MAYKIHKIEKLCCGSSAYLIELDKPIKKNQINFFIDAGFLVPESYTSLGIFYAQKNKLIATCTFDRTSINIRCGGAECANSIKEFAEIADAITIK